MGRNSAATMQLACTNRLPRPCSFARNRTGSCWRSPCAGPLHKGFTQGFRGDGSRSLDGGHPWQLVGSQLVGQGIARGNASDQIQVRLVLCVIPMQFF